MRRMVLIVCRDAASLRHDTTCLFQCERHAAAAVSPSVYAVFRGIYVGPEKRRLSPPGAETLDILDSELDFDTTCSFHENNVSQTKRWMTFTHTFSPIVASSAFIIRRPLGDRCIFILACATSQPIFISRAASLGESQARSVCQPLPLHLHVSFGIVETIHELPDAGDEHRATSVRQQKDGEIGLPYNTLLARQIFEWSDWMQNCY